MCKFVCVRKENRRHYNEVIAALTEVAMKDYFLRLIKNLDRWNDMGLVQRKPDFVT